MNGLNNCVLGATPSDSFYNSTQTQDMRNNNDIVMQSQAKGNIIYLQ